MLSKLDNLNISHTRCEHQASLKPSPGHLPYLTLWKQSASLNTPVHSQVEVYIEVGFTSTSALDTVPKSTGHKNVESIYFAKNSITSASLSLWNHILACPILEMVRQHHILIYFVLTCSNQPNRLVSVMWSMQVQVIFWVEQNTLGPWEVSKPRFSVCMALAKRWFGQPVWNMLVK